MNVDVFAKELLRRSRAPEAECPALVTEIVRADKPGTGSDERTEAVATALLRDHGVRDLPLIRALIAALMVVRGENGGCGDDLYALCFVLSMIGEPDDVFLLYAAKHTNFDAGCMIDHDLLRMRYSRDTMLAAVKDGLARRAREHGRWAQLPEDVKLAFDEPDHGEREEHWAELRGYFGVATSIR
jgi:hypothetical protein